MKLRLRKTIPRNAGKVGCICIQFVVFIDVGTRLSAGYQSFPVVFSFLSALRDSFLGFFLATGDLSIVLGSIVSDALLERSPNKVPFLMRFFIQLFQKHCSR